LDRKGTVVLAEAKNELELQSATSTAGGPLPSSPSGGSSKNASPGHLHPVTTLMSKLSTALTSEEGLALPPGAAGVPSSTSRVIAPPGGAAGSSSSPNAKGGGSKSLSRKTSQQDLGTQEDADILGASTTSLLMSTTSSMKGGLGASTTSGAAKMLSNTPHKEVSVQELATPSKNPKHMSHSQLQTLLHSQKEALGLLRSEQAQAEAQHLFPRNGTELKSWKKKLLSTRAYAHLQHNKQVDEHFNIL
ncbi:unnamed protein product, partial [Amoebophrya sp. A25]